MSGKPSATLFTLQQIAAAIGGRIVGDDQCTVRGVGTLEKAGPDEIAFLANRKYRRHLTKTKAAAVLIKSTDVDFISGTGIVVADPYVAYAKVTQLLFPAATAAMGIAASAQLHPSATIAASASISANVVIGAGSSIGAECQIGPNCVIEENVRIGSFTRLVANVTVCFDSRIGERCLIHPGVVIGADGFGFANDRGSWIKINQLGAVEIGNDVEIGANSTIDRGALENTIIADGVKLDNLVQVAHNVVIGAHTAIAAQTAIAGSTTIGAHCAIGGKVGIVGHIHIVDHVQITGMSHVTQSISEPGSFSSGTPLESTRKWHKNYLRFKQLDQMARRLKDVEKTLDRYTKKS